MHDLRAAPLVAMALLSFAIACDSPTGPVAELSIPDVTLEAVGDEASLHARLGGEDVAASWTSLAPHIVSITPSGRAVAVSAGTAAVRATRDGVTAEGRVTVLPPVEIQLTELALVTDPSGQTGVSMRIRNVGGRGFFRLEFWAFDSDGSHRRVLHYTSDLDAPVGLDIVHQNYLLTEPADWVVALSREPASLEHVQTACVRLDGGSECPGESPPPPAPVVDSVYVGPAAAVLSVGDFVQYAARAFADGVELFGETITWSTPSPTIISIDENGLVRALRPGYGQVEATVGGVTAAVGLTVMTPEPVVGQITIGTGGLPLRLWVGQSRALQATVYDTQGRLITGKTVTWKVGDAAVAAVDSAGVVRGVGHGGTLVGATVDGLTMYTPARVFAVPAGRAELLFSGFFSDSSTWSAWPPFETTWVDSLDVAHPAYLIVEGGRLSLDWSGPMPAYTQSMVLGTYLRGATLSAKVAETEVVENGVLTVFHDLFTGMPMFELAPDGDATRKRLARFSLPGELVMEQAVGGIPTTRYYFQMP